MKGTYVLFLESSRNLGINAGKLGPVQLQKGRYAYVGSAMGRGASLENRIGRHEKLAKEKRGKLRWHIDYFTTAPGVEVTDVVRINGKDVECRLARLLEKSCGKTIAEGFGSSDCKCKTHFFSLSEKTVKNFMRMLPDAV